jgi:hypothetical protein
MSIVKRAAAQGSAVAVGAALWFSSACGSSDSTGYLPLDAGDDSSGSGGAVGGSGGAVGGSGGAVGGSGGAVGGSGGTGGSSPCSSDVDCAAGRCAPDSATCVECLFDSDCGSTRECVDRSCFAVKSCQNSLDCVGDPAGRSVCDPASGTCVVCIADADCGASAECLAGACVSYLPCENSLQCPAGTVCKTDRCVACVFDADCASGEVCVQDACNPGCQSDNQCTPLGMLCDQALGACVRCLTSGDCGEHQWCSAGTCRIDACLAGETSCQSGGLVTCEADGRGFGSPTPCGTRQTCSGTAGSAACTDWVCEPGQTYCDGTRVVECSADGLTVLSETDCSSTSQLCFQGACSNLVCVPDLTFCDANTLRRCAADGLSSSVLDTCTTTEWCDAAGSACQPQVCSPGEPACDGTRATTCNATGSGYSAGGTDCAPLNMSCSAGVCVACPPTRADAVPAGQALYLMLDKSGSMGTDCNVGSTTASKWCRAINGLAGFLGDSSSAGLDVALQYFPIPGYTCTGNGGSLATPAVTGSLPDDYSAFVSSLNTEVPNGSNTPIEAALRGLAAHTTSMQQAGLDPAGVLITDGAPNGCSTSATTLAGILASHYSSTGIRTFVVGMTGANYGTLEAIAQGGAAPLHSDYCGTTPPCRHYDVGGGDPVVFQAVLQEIRAASSSCSYEVPTEAGAPVAASRITLEYRPGGTGSAVVLSRQSSASTCGEGWYLDTTTTPARITLCPSTCTTVIADASRKLGTVVSCQ